MPSKTIQLIKAASRADFRQVALLLREGAQVNGLDKDGTGALRCAVTRLGFFKRQVIRGRLVRIRGAPLEDVYKTVRLLLKAGADPNLGDEYGTPLLSAAGDGNLPVVRMLIEAGALPNPAHETGITPLASAMYRGRAKVVEYLLRHGADPLLKDAEGQSILKAAKLLARNRGAGYQPIYEMVQAAYARLPKSGGTMPASQSFGSALGIKDFTRMDVHPEWSVFAVKAPADVVARVLADFRKPIRFERRVPLKPAKKFEQIAPLTAVVRIKANPWTVVLRSVGDVSAQEIEGVPEEAKMISAKLKTRAVSFLCEDTSNAMCYALYERGRLLEEAEWECGGEMSSFTSTLRQRPKGRRFTEDFADQLFRSEGIYIPVCYPRLEGSRVWLSVQKPSFGLIERADLLELGKIATPVFNRVHHRLVAKMRKTTNALKRKGADA